MKAPRDPNQPEFTRWFYDHEVEQYKQFFDEWGFVVVKVLTEEECHESVEDIWSYVENYMRTKTKNHPPDRFDPLSWECWPEMANEGILGSNPVWTPQALSIRQHPKIYQVFSNLLNKAELFVNHDRYGLFRPTRDVSFTNAKGEIETRSFPEWETMWNVHLDMNPWSYVANDDTGSKRVEKLSYKFVSHFIEENNELGKYSDGIRHLQGLINFKDNYEADGGIQVVPGFVKEFHDWTIATKDTLRKQYGFRNNFIVLPPDLAVTERAERVCAPAGCLVIWDQRTIHGSAPNSSPNPRFCQFLKYFHAVDPASARFTARATAVTAKIEAFEPSPLGKKLFGLEPW